MKKFLLSCLLIIAAGVFCSCSGDAQFILPQADLEPVQPENLIAASELTPEQQEIIDILSVPYFEMYSYDFKTDETYHKIEVWVEEYQNGEFIGYPVKIEMVLRGKEKHEGYITIMVNQQEACQWTLSVLEKELESKIRVSDFGGAEIISDSRDCVFGPMEESLSLEDGKELIIYRALYTAGNRGYNCQTLQENPQLLKEFPVAYLVKCKFLND